MTDDYDALIPILVQFQSRFNFRNLIFSSLLTAIVRSHPTTDHIHECHGLTEKFTERKYDIQNKSQTTKMEPSKYWQYWSIATFHLQKRQIRS